MKCAYDKCENKATGKCEGNQKYNSKVFTYDPKQSFLNDCGEYFCQDHLKWGWGCFCINGCVASPQCPKHHTGNYCILL